MKIARLIIPVVVIFFAALGGWLFINSRNSPIVPSSSRSPIPQTQPASSPVTATKKLASLPPLLQQYGWKQSSTPAESALFLDGEGLFGQIDLPGKLFTISTSKETENIESEFFAQMEKGGWQQNDKLGKYKIHAIVADGPMGGGEYGFVTTDTKNVQAVILSINGDNYEIFVSNVATIDDMLLQVAK